MAFVFFFRFGDDPVLFGALFDVFWGLRWVLVGFMLVIMVKNCKLWVFGEHQVGLGCFCGGSLVFREFLSVLGVILFILGLFLTCFGVSVAF